MPASNSEARKRAETDRVRAAFVSDLSIVLDAARHHADMLDEGEYDVIVDAAGRLSVLLGGD